MRRFINAIAICTTLLVIFGLYALKTDTRALDRRVVELTKLVDRGKADVATLRAEWSYLTEPQRIERLARRHLGYRPVDPKQYQTPRAAGLPIKDTATAHVVDEVNAGHAGGGGARP